MDHSQDNHASQENTKSRRRFVSWLGQVSAGASLAVLGLSADSLKALANSSSRRSDTPDCYACPPGCHITTYCQYDTGCDVETGGTRPFLTTWTTQAGCVGHCYTISHSECEDNLCIKPC